MHSGLISTARIDRRGEGSPCRPRAIFSAGDFAAKWRQATTTEKAGSQEHFIRPCGMLSQPTSHDVDLTGDTYAYKAVHIQLLAYSALCLAPGAGPDALYGPP